MGKINESIKPTLDEPTSNQAIDFQDGFDDAMISGGVQLDEVDTLLNEKEQSLKRKIWSLAKMETLVHADPKLSAVYDNMSADGEEKYGYHYNETIMNIIFNDYVLNDPKYLERYKQSIGKEKKRRDKSGINALRKDAEDMEVRRSDYRDKKKGGSDVQSLNERMKKLRESSSSIAGSGGGSFESPIGFKDDIKNVSKQIDTVKEFADLAKVIVSLPGKENRAYGKQSPLSANVSSAVDNPVENKNTKKPFYPGGTIVTAESKGVKLDKVEPAKHSETTPQNNIKENFEQMAKDKDIKIDNPEDQIDETTSAGGAGGSAGYVGYSGPAAWGSGDLTNGKKTKKDKDSFWTGGEVIQESDYLTDPSGFEKLFESLNEEFEPKNPEGLADNTNEKEEDYIVQYDSDRTGEDPFELNGIKWQFVNAIYPDGKRDIGVYRFGHDLVYGYEWFRNNIIGDNRGNAPITENPAMMEQKQENEINPEYTHFAVYKPNGKIITAWEYDGYDAQELKSDVRHYFYGDVEDEGFSTKDVRILNTKTLQRRGLDPFDINNWYTERFTDSNFEPNYGVDESVIDQQEDSMKMGEPINTQGSDFPTGMQIAGGISENEYENIVDDEFLKEANNDLESIGVQHNSLKEDRKPSTLVMKDRLGVDNAKNFKSDLKHSGTKEMIDITKELEWKEQQTDVSADPSKLSKELEKQTIKNSVDGTSLKNVGNSANDKGGEIPKRNMTTEETDEVDLYRKGLGDFVYDNKPDDAYMERMKNDMGDAEFKKREDRIKFEAEAPMYNKDTQPVEDGIDKKQFNKSKSKWNDRMGVNESVVTGKHKNKIGKNVFVDFVMKDVIEVSKIEEGFIPLNLDGMGNTYSNTVELNESVSNAISNWNFYLVEGTQKIVAHKQSQILAESDHREMKPVVNEQFSKMKHLLGYDSKEYINTKKNKV